MNRILPLAAAVIALPLAACNHKTEEVDNTAPDPMASQLANAPTAELPPSIEATKTFRCTQDNSLVYVDFFNGGKQVNLRTEEDGTPTTLTSETEGGPWTKGDTKISGDQDKIEYTADGKTLSCHV
ncbi:hypothetical protein KY084_02465 [Stakelama sp. CBK3Z-3]|uniref:C-type lysozyme inhibitor domain-containing protein n=2 Tax=Stakelama flava TaxID=2860338 RepID=A0ABS6XHR2_9SPHN|nr:hypothetical protein [Stakelama flava]